MPRYFITLLTLFAFIAYASPASSQSKVLTEAVPAAVGF